MSVVAAAALVDRLLVTADSRLTARCSDGREVYYDNTLKLFPCGPFSVIGFAGDVDVGAELLRILNRQAGARMRRGRNRNSGAANNPAHPNSLHRWIPRFLRTEYAASGSEEPLEVLVASVIPEVPNVLSRRMAAALFWAALRTGGGSTPEWLNTARKVMEETGVESLPMPGTFAPRILLLESPTFNPRRLGPFSFAAIGSGRQVVYAGAESKAGHLLASQYSQMAEIIFDSTVSSACTQAGISTVGGLRPAYELSTAGVRPLPKHVTKRVGNVDRQEIRLECHPGMRWIQRNVTTGVNIELLPPWQAIKDLPPRGRVFGSDYFD